MDEARQQQITITEKQPRWTPTANGFARLLKWLDGGRDSQGQKYEEMRSRLVTFFDRKNCAAPDDLADETLNRVMKWVEEHDRHYDEEPAKICYNTARFVFHEHLRKPAQAAEDISDLSKPPAVDPHAIAAREEEQETQEKRLTCLQTCSQKLPGEDRELIVRYYYGEQRVKLDNRKMLAAERGMTANALSIKACRIRDKLRACVTTCVCA
ncbi:MAG: hypothetical protein U0Y68_06925 [Blastocatellia bacterium]